MNKKGFTLIELLAVIVILAVIALIITPVITNIVSSSKKSAAARTTEQYMEAVNISVSSSLLTESNIADGRYYVNKNGNIEHTGKEYEVKIKGSKPTSGFVVVQKGKVISGNIIVNGNSVTYKEGQETVVNSSNSKKIYGLEYNISTKTYTRLNDAVGLNACAGTNKEICNNDFDFAEIYRDMIETTDEYGNIFIKIPKFYIKKEVSDTILRWYVSKTKQDNSYYLPNCFYDFNSNKELDYVLVGKYDSSLSEDNKRLMSITNSLPLVSRKMVDQRKFALANNTSLNTGYQLFDIHVLDAIKALFYVEFATIDSQSIMPGYSYGISPYQEIYKPLENATNTNVVKVTSENIKAFRVGQTINISLSNTGKHEVAYNQQITNINYDTNEITFSGDPVNLTTTMYLSNSYVKSGMTDDLLTSSGSYDNNNDGKYPMNYRGIENLYGNISEMVDGVIIDNYTDGTWKIYVNKNANTYVTNSITSNYNLINTYSKPTSNGYIKKMGYDSNYPYVELPTIVSSIDSSLYKDEVYSNNVQDLKVIFYGGNYRANTQVGITGFDFTYNDNNVLSHVGSRLVKKQK